MTNVFESVYDRKAEVDKLLLEDDTLIGRVYRHEKDGLTPLQIAEAEGNERANFVYNYRVMISALLESEVPKSPTLALQAARKVSAWLKAKDLSPALRADLETVESLLRSRATDKEAQAEEIEAAVSVTKNAESSATPGIYVYTLPHFMKHPVDEATGKTLLKVGHSGKDAYYRAGSAGRLTALPEDPILLRIYPADESAEKEKEFHAWLRDADHKAGRTKRAGAEWFVTSTRFLDRVARSLGLEIRVINDFDAGDE